MSKRATAELSDFEDLFENGAMPIHLVGPDGKILRANKAELDMLGYSADEYVGRNVIDFHVDRHAIDDILARLSRREQLDWYPARLRAKDGAIKDVEITSSVRTHNGKVLNTRCFTRDVTELKRAQAKLQEERRYLATILNALPAALYTTDAAGRITYFNEAAVKLAGRTPELAKDQWCVTWRLRTADGTPLAHEECPMAIALKEDRSVRDIAAYAERPDGTLVPFLPYPTPLHDESGALTGGINMLIDISEQKQREEQLTFVMHELSHRSKNLLAVVQSVANRSLRNTSSLQEFERKFMGRIQAMARSHDILIANSWVGADIREIIEAEMVGFLGREQEQRARLTGERIVLTPSVAQSVSLAVHELATNAAKYGAFAKDDGCVEVEWRPHEGKAIAFRWREQSGSRIAKPRRKGYGTQILGSLFKQPRFDFAPSGLEFSGVLPHAVN